MLKSWCTINAPVDLIGINTSTVNPDSRSPAGVGFAVPSNLLIEALSKLEPGDVCDHSDMDTNDIQ